MALEPGHDLFKPGVPAEGTPLISEEIRNNFRALAQHNYTTDAGYPSNPSEGMFRINAVAATNVKLELYVGGAWRTVVQHIEAGFAAPVKKVVQFTTPTNPWTIDHNMGSYPLVAILDSSSFQMRLVPQGTAPGAKEFTLQHASANRFVVTFDGVKTGFCVYIG